MCKSHLGWYLLLGASFPANQDGKSVSKQQDVCAEGGSSWQAGTGLQLAPDSLDPKALGYRQEACRRNRSRSVCLSRCSPVQLLCRPEPEPPVLIGESKVRSVWASNRSEIPQADS